MRFIWLSDINAELLTLVLAFGCSGSEFSEDTFIAKVKMEIVVCKEQVIALFYCFEVLEEKTALPYLLREIGVIYSFYIFAYKFL